MNKSKLNQFGVQEGSEVVIIDHLSLMHCSSSETKLKMREVYSEVGSMFGFDGVRVF